MDRETFCKKIIEKIEKLEKISKNDMECSSKYGRGLKAFNDEKHRQGIYFLYNSNDQIIYIGKVGTGCSTSLYDRMSGHGSGAHNKQQWYKEVVYGKYIIFKHLNDSEIEIVERLCIVCNPNKKNYNDKVFDDTVLDEINQKLK